MTSEGELYLIDYFKWADEYFKTADDLKKVIDKYEQMLKEGKVKNSEAISSKLSKYRTFYNEAVGTARILKRRAVELERRLNHEARNQ